MDKKARDILFKTYWTSAGWIRDENRIISSTDFEYAKGKSLMFDPFTISKQELIFNLSKIYKEVLIKKVVDAFLCSLTMRRLDWRSGLASYVNIERLLTDKDVFDYCYGYGEDLNLNVLNFERIKWGGVRHYSGLYNWLDLTLLEKDTIPTPTNFDIEILKNILDVIGDSEVGETPSKLRDRLKGVIKASKSELNILMEILSCAEILKPLRFDRKVPGTHDWTFVLHWRGEDKYDKQNVKKYFSEYGLS